MKAFLLPITLLLAVLPIQPSHGKNNSYGEAKIGNVCIALQSEYAFTFSSEADFHLVNIVAGSGTSRVYIGHNPQLDGDNRKWESPKLLSSLNKPVVVTLAGSQEGDLLGIPADSSKFMFHVSRSSKGAVSDHIRKLLRFC